MNKKIIIVGGVVAVVAIILIVLFMPGTTESGSIVNDINSSVAEAQIDESLTGKELIDSLNYEEPKTMKCKFKMTIEEEGYSSESILYYKDSSTRIETANEEGEYIIIYNDTEKVTYMYDPNEKTGTMFEFTEEDEEETGFLDLFEENYDIARVEELNGDKVIYTEKSEDGDLIKTYHSAKNGIPILIEEYENGELVSTQEMSDVELNGNVSDSLFEKPSDIEFSDMSDLFDFEF